MTVKFAAKQKLINANYEQVDKTPDPREKDANYRHYPSRNISCSSSNSSL